MLYTHARTHAHTHTHSTYIPVVLDDLGDLFLLVYHPLLDHHDRLFPLADLPVHRAHLVPVTPRDQAPQLHPDHRLYLVHLQVHLRLLLLERPVSVLWGGEGINQYALGLLSSISQIVSSS